MTFISPLSLVLLTFIIIVNGQNCGVRTRKSWRSLTRNEKRLYVDALSLAAERGLIYEFSKVHRNSLSEMEAHKSCGFVLWHRAYLTAFENMLRDMGNRFRCITIPYVNSMEAQQNFPHNCDSFQTCFDIFKDIGGEPAEEETEHLYHGYTVKGHCYTRKPFDAYMADDDQITCMVRNNLNEIKITPSMGYVQLFSLISSHTTYAAFVEALMMNHNYFHLSTGGVMGTMISPTDPVFFNWHATVDMIYNLWHLCHSPEELVEGTQAYNNYAFEHDESCFYDDQVKAQFNGNEITLESTILMLPDGTDVRENSKIGKYFNQGLTYQDFVDFKTMSTENEVQYAYPEDFNTRLLYNDLLCPNGIRPTLPPTTTPPPPPPPTTTQDGSTRPPSSTPETTPTPTPTPEPEPELTEEEKNKAKYWIWYEETMATLNATYPNDPQRVMQEFTIAECIFYRDEIGLQEIDEDLSSDFLIGDSDQGASCEKEIDLTEGSGFDSTAIDKLKKPPALVKEKSRTKSKDKSNSKKSSAYQVKVSFLLIYLSLSFLFNFM